MNEPQTIIVSSDCTCVKYVAVQSRKFSYSFISNHLKRNSIIPIGRATTKTTTSSSSSSSSIVNVLFYFNWMNVLVLMGLFAVCSNLRKINKELKKILRGLHNMGECAVLHTKLLPRN